MIGRAHDGGMRAPRWSWLAAGAMVGLLGLSGGLDVVAGPDIEEGSAGEAIAAGVPMLVLVGVACLLVLRRPGNRVGWVLAGAATAFSLASVTYYYAEIDLRVPGVELPLAAWAGWAGVVVGTTGFLTALVFLPLLFPDGRPPGPRWSIAGYAGGLGTAIAVAGVALRPGEFDEVPGVDNPAGALPAAVADGLSTAGLVAVFGAFVAAFASVVVRYRRADATGRAQVKWFAYVLGVFAVLALSANLVTGGNVRDHVVLDVITSMLLVGGIPVAIAVAILRHGLYDIDRLFRRSIVYAVLWALVTGAYVGVAVLLGLAATARLPIAVAVLVTVVVTLLATPVRHWLVRLADRMAGSFTRDVDAMSRRAAELAASRARIVAAAEAERRRIEQNIHDGAQQELIALMAKLRLAGDVVAADPRRAGELLAEMQAETRQLLQGLRELAQGIHPTVLTDRGLADAVEDRMSRLPLDIAVDIDPEVRTRRFADEIEGTAYFVVSEALANTLKHADAGRAIVRLAVQNGALRVDVRDDGRGFLPGRTGGSGLASLTDRVDALGGRLDVRSEPGSGTTVAAALPARAPGEP